ncbi:MAG: hypothetical protein FJW38_12075 [Acidobacteria bacterium]|nr:hypothetical protein [Acidobacteriota bacterium]
MISRRALLAAVTARERCDFLRLDLQTNEVLTEDWHGSVDESIDPGSLWKPIAAMQLRGASPFFECRGCWAGRRHGRIDVVDAIGYSCNEWFRQWGVRGEVPNSAIGYALSFAELLRRRAEHPAVIAGLRMAAALGTASALGGRYLAKTGTGPSKKHAGDGWVIAAWPADSPQQLALLRAPGVTGAQAAKLLRERVERERW